MPRKRINEPVVVTDEQILAYDNVPVPIAAQYIGWTPNKLYYALQDHQVPFGFVTERESEKRACGASWTYNISPGLLVAYKRGTLTVIPRADLIRLVQDAVSAATTK